ncbi:MAG: hypothetical protein XD95_0315 [Microgenomates bacterium 39_7]|nr:MAG: hypothetical protein XD95_0315 [Microgenomates bacterium 39_7]
MNTKRGFTLIELLIVITLLGILAVAVLSAINPIEQINRSRDTSSRSDAEQLINAIDRYYATVGYYPWRDAGDQEFFPAPQVFAEVNDEWVDTKAVSVLGKLTAEGTAEVKESFTNRIKSSATPLHVYNRGGQGDSTYVCFEPRSSAFLTEAEDRCSAELPDDFPVADVCPAEGTAYSCLP